MVGATALLALSFGKLQFAPTSILLGLAATFISTIALFSLIRIAEPDSIATLRRVGAMILAGTLLWLFASSLELLYVLLMGATQSRGALTFGAFLTCAFELIVINGAFVEKTKFAGPLSVVHPATILVWSNLIANVNIQAVAAGGAVIGLALGFIFKLKGMRTTTRDSSIQTLQAFLKAWVIHNPKDLERILSHYSLEESVSTKIIKFDAPVRKPTIVLPGIHPGPFYPVGSYNLPELLFARFGAGNLTALTMHRPGGHERNLPSQAESVRYADETAIFAERTQARNPPTDMRGPLFAKINGFAVSCLAFGNQALVTISSSPLSSDDIAYSTEGKLLPLAKECSFELSIVDAHNSIGNERIQFEVGDDRPWRDLFERLRREEEHEFRVGFAHSSELGFDHGPDISDAGMGVLVFQVKDVNWALVLVDSNNATPKSKEEVREKLESVGFRLIELCTSDSHNLAARVPTLERGYFALGESTPIADVALAVTKLGQIAESRLSSYKYGIDELVSSVSVFGVRAIDDLASLVRRSSAFAKRYTMLAAPLAVVLLLLTVVN